MAIDERPDVSRAHGSPLRRREFRLYFGGNLISNIGNWLQHVVLAVYMHQLTDSSFWVGMVGLGMNLPVLLFALPAGALADRYDRVTLLRRSQVFAGALAIALTILVATDTANRYVVTAIAFGIGTAIAVAIPTMQSLIPNLVPHDELPDAIRMNALSFNLARLVGPVVAAATVATVGIVWAFGINAATFIALIVALAMIGTAPFQRPADKSAGKIREGIAYAWRHLRTRWMLLSIVAIGITLDPITTLAPAISQRLALGESGAGWIVASWGGGAVLMIVFGRGLIRTFTEHGLGWVGLIALSGGVAGLGVIPVPMIALAFAVLSGAGYISATMVFTTTIQSSVPESLRGRVSALWTLAFLGPRSFASVLDGALADAAGSQWAAVAFASVALVAALFLRRVDGSRNEPIPPPA